MEEITLYTKADYVSMASKLVIIVHGLAEHSGRYDELTKFLNEHNISVFRYDLRGHGKSGGKRGALRSYTEMLDDLQNIITKVREQNKDVKIFLLGHSMGGLIVNLFASLQGFDEISGVISSGAATNFLPMIQALRIFPYRLIAFKKIKNNCEGLLTFDQSVEDAYKADPLVLKEYSISLIGAMFIDGVKTLLKNRRNLRLPILYLHGKDDMLVPCWCSENMYEHIASVDKEIHIIEHSKHEIFNDYEKRKAFNAVLQWLNAH